MAEQHGSRKLTRADVLVIAAVCLLLAFLVPVLFAKPREQAVRKLCAANLAQIGKAMLIYADDNGGDLPRAGGPGTVWLGMPGGASWTMPDRRMAFSLAADGSGGSASINSSLYLLVKYYQMPPRMFVCKGDQGTTEFKLSSLIGMIPNFELSDAWDFGPLSESFKHCSYAYHTPYNLYALNTSWTRTLPWRRIETPGS
jgi:type II secretory pathway pseudopilin PulG